MKKLLLVALLPVWLFSAEVNMKKLTNGLFEFGYITGEAFMSLDFKLSMKGFKKEHIEKIKTYSKLWNEAILLAYVKDKDDKVLECIFTGEGREIDNLLIAFALSQLNNKESKSIKEHYCYNYYLLGDKIRNAFENITINLND